MNRTFPGIHIQAGFRFPGCMSCSTGLRGHVYISINLGAVCV